MVDRDVPVFGEKAGAVEEGEDEEQYEQVSYGDRYPSHMKLPPGLRPAIGRVLRRLGCECLSKVSRKLQKACYSRRF
jgi:hypothetical protein